MNELLSVIDALRAGYHSTLPMLDALADRSELPKDVATAVQHLMHYVANADIREREPEYAEHLKAKLEAMRDELHSIGSHSP